MTTAEYLQELKAHNWHWGFGSINPHYHGRRKEEQLKALAAADPQLQALRGAYRAFRFGEGPEPTAEEAKAPAEVKATTNYDRRAILWEAWHIAPTGARRFGFPARAFIAEAMRQAWAKARSLNTSTPTGEAMGLFVICIDEKTGRNTRAINPPLIDQVFTDRGQAEAALAIRGAFGRPFIKTSRHYRLH